VRSPWRTNESKAAASPAPLPVVPGIPTVSVLSRKRTPPCRLERQLDVTPAPRAEVHSRLPTRPDAPEAPLRAIKPIPAHAHSAHRLFPTTDPIQQPQSEMRAAAPYPDATPPASSPARISQKAWRERVPLGAVKLVDDLAGESPVSASFPVGTVVISGDGAGNQTVESPEVNVLVGWVRIRSAPTGGLTKQQVVAQANRSQASKILPSPESECEDVGNAETIKRS
jgi:hypothetical protein